MRVSPVYVLVQYERYVLVRAKGRSNMKKCRFPIPCFFGQNGHADKRMESSLKPCIGILGTMCDIRMPDHAHDGNPFGVNRRVDACSFRCSSSRFDSSIRTYKVWRSGCTWLPSFLAEGIMDISCAVWRDVERPKPRHACCLAH